MKRKIFILVGLPGAGKTTWAKNYVKDHPDTLTISMDDLRRCLHGEKYIFDEKFEPIIYIICNNIIEIILSNCNNDIIIDETNIKTIRRKSLINLINIFNSTKNYQIIAVVFTENKKNLIRRIKDNRGYSKEKWENIINNMKKNYEPVKKSEGFNKIVYI